MNDSASVSAAFAQAAQGVPCQLPWTSLEEGNIGGSYRVCCWTETRLGVLPKENPGKIADIWNGEPMVTMRRALAENRLAGVCPPDCLVPKAKAKRGYLDFYEYDSAEYDSFDNRFKDNRLAVVESLGQRQAKVDTHPLRMKFHPSNLCNLACPMCLRHGKDLKREIAPGYYENIFSEMPYLEDLTIYGGEFLACPTSRRVVFGPEIRQHPQLHYSVTTNGTLWDRATLERLADLRFGKIIVSLDAATEKTYQAIRINGKHATTMANVERMVRWRERGKLRVNLMMAAFVVMAANHHELPDFIEMCHNLGIRPYIIPLEESNELDHILAQVAESVEQGREKAKELGEATALMLLDLVAAKLAKAQRKQSAA